MILSCEYFRFVWFATTDEFYSFGLFFETKKRLILVMFPLALLPLTYTNILRKCKNILFALILRVCYFLVQFISKTMPKNITAIVIIIPWEVCLFPLKMNEIIRRLLWNFQRFSKIWEYNNMKPEVECTL